MSLLRTLYRLEFKTHEKLLEIKLQLAELTEKIEKIRANALENLTNLAILSAASQSIAPAAQEGWLATIPADRPPNRANPMITFGAKSFINSKK